MESLLILIFNLGLLAIYAAVGVIAFMLVQLIIYQTTGFSIIRYLYKKLIIEQM